MKYLSQQRRELSLLGLLPLTVATANGGHGAVRELCEKILHQQQLWDRIESCNSCGIA